MAQAIERPFDSIDDTHEFFTLLAQTVYEARLDIEADVKRESNGAVTRRLQALRLAVYTLTKLEQHLVRSRRALNDLRTLRRLLFQERYADAASVQHKLAQMSGKGSRLETLKPVTTEASRSMASA